MTSYNDYSGETRERAAKWQKASYTFGLRPLPTRCAACGQTEGIIVGHWETYEEPFHLNEDIPLCSICHLWVHSRKRYSIKFKAYIAAVASGCAREPMRRFDWDGFKRAWLDADPLNWPEFIAPHEPGDVAILARIESGEMLEACLLAIHGTRPCAAQL